MCHRYQWDAIENEKKMFTHSSERRWGNKNVWLREHFLVTLQNIFSSIFRWIFIISFFSLLLDFATRLLTVLRAKISANQETVWCFASNHQQLSNLITQNVTHMPHTPRSTTLLVWSNHIHNNHKRKHYVDFSPRIFFMFKAWHLLPLHWMSMPKNEKKIEESFLVLLLPFKSNIRSQSATWINCYTVWNIWRLVKCFRKYQLR